MSEVFTPSHEYTLGKSTVIDTLTLGRVDGRPAIVWKRRDGESRIVVFKWATLSDVAGRVGEHEARFITAEFMYDGDAQPWDTSGMKWM
ncbi:hypothetical protein [Streptomyces lavendulae]|uniref:hypothetical protein n=1 Tax=Streptomyces lavendulae TaxID=1914 RepID=UPI0024A2D000|nr:hypothetical protein [Streptomyces lavendulae]GLW03715.1 hypothetical protein Slala05_73450 [Streptomyces lavendulae subsp. lavendulae]